MKNFCQRLVLAGAGSLSCRVCQFEVDDPGHFYCFDCLKLTASPSPSLVGGSSASTCAGLYGP